MLQDLERGRPMEIDALLGAVVELADLTQKPAPLCRAVLAMVRERARLIRSMGARIADLDVLVCPTTPIVAPTMAEVATREEFARKNAMLLRNTVVVNFFDLCAISLPMPREDGLPTGLMLIARNGNDHRLFRIAAAVERLLAA